MDPFLSGNQNLIRQLGMDCTYTVITQGAYDVNTSQVLKTEVYYTIKAAQGTLRRSEQDSVNFTGKQSCAIYILPSTSFVPKPSDVIIFDSNTLEVKEVQTQRGLQGQVAGYKLLCIKG